MVCFLDMVNDARIRDMLAYDRTALANERTLLSYGRTALGLIALAAVIFKFADAETAMIVGSLSLTGAALVMFWGFRSYRLVAAKIQEGISQGVSSEDLVLAVDD